MKNFLRCNTCGGFTEIKSEYLVFCEKCNKKLDPHYAAWKKKNPTGTLEEFKEKFAHSADQIIKLKKASKPKKSTKGIKILIALLLVGLIATPIFFFDSQKIMDTILSSSKNIILTNSAEEMNQKCPMMLDAETRLDHCDADPEHNIFAYHHTLVNYTKGQADEQSIIPLIEPGIIKAIKVSTDLALFRELKTIFKYYFKDKNGAAIFTLEIGPEKYLD